MTTAPALAEAESWRAWDRFVEGSPGAGFMQTSWWALFRAGIGLECFAAVFKDEDAIVGGALVSRHCEDPGGCFYYIQDGPVLPADEPAAAAVFSRVLEIVERRRREDPETVSHLRIEPRLERLPGFVSGFRPAPADDYSEARNSLAVDLRPPEERILAQMKPKGRYNIGLARRHGVTVAEDDSERGLSDFLRIYRRTGLRQRMAVKPPSYFRELLALARPLGKASLFFAEHQGRRLAAALVLYCGPRATYFYGGSLELRRRVMAPYLLHFEIMRRAKADGLQWYDLWGIEPDDKPDDPWYGLSVFKRKFGGVEVRLAPGLDYVYDDQAYARYLSGGARHSPHLGGRP